MIDRDIDIAIVAAGVPHGPVTAALVEAEVIPLAALGLNDLVLPRIEDKLSVDHPATAKRGRNTENSYQPQ